MPTPRTDTAHTGPVPGSDEAEAALVEHYPRLVRLAYLTLPPALGRHRRVLAAHRAVQRALPRAHSSAPGVTVGRERAYAWVRADVLRASLARERRSLRDGALRAVGGGLPFVAGLRLFPRAGGRDELRLDQALSTLDAAARAALALRVLEELPPSAVLSLLTEAGAAAPDEAVRAADRLAAEQEGRAEELLGTGEFDPCTVQTRPTDLLRRRQRRRLASTALAFAALGVVVAAALSDSAGPDPAVVAAGPAGNAASGALDPRQVLRAPAGAWSHSSRVDFTVWPARGARVRDTALIGRALAAWGTAPGGGQGRLAVSATPGTDAAPPQRPPQLLYAANAGQAAVVLLFDGSRVARYAESVAAPGGAAALDVSRADDGDVTTAAALVVSRTADSVRYLLAPWVTETTSRDLLRPDTPARTVNVAPDGVTGPVAAPAAGASCGSWPALQLRSSPKIVEKHAFLVTDLGDLSPVHLTYTPPPGRGAPARPPREATSGPALVSWARTACSLPDLRGAGARSVNNWAFAQQNLPEHGGRATWVCSRADTWSGPGRVLVQFQQPAPSPASPGTFVAKAENTALCSRFGQHVMAGTRWRSPAGHWYLLAAGSRAVTSITATGGVRAGAKAATLAVRAPRTGTVDLSARLASGGRLQGVASVESVP
ncbi:hypothetical protein [Streptomyces sp. NBC_01497]|uniref:hypothetical protein n=1 Tax=Streptomyces sp. NBC_01497 TaxID=2903885 RepID=UPI002E2F1792|nr:hypothetical protein [Streptomyces sp. NBC_01497]